MQSKRKTRRVTGISTIILKNFCDNTQFLALTKVFEQSRNCMRYIKHIETSSSISPRLECRDNIGEIQMKSIQCSSKIRSNNNIFISKAKFTTCIEVLFKKKKKNDIYVYTRVFFITFDREFRVSARSDPPGNPAYRGTSRHLGSLRSEQRGTAKHAGVSSMTRVHARRLCVACVNVTRVRAATRRVWWYHPLNAKPPAPSPPTPPWYRQPTGNGQRSCTRARCTRRIPNRTENALRGPA